MSHLHCMISFANCRVETVLLQWTTYIAADSTPDDVDHDMQVVCLQSFLSELWRPTFFVFRCILNNIAWGAL